MRALFVFIVLLAGLFALAYFTKRRFGILGLALCAGALLSTGWTSSLTPWLEQQGIVVVTPPLSSLVATTLILGPALLLLFGGPIYSKIIPRIVGALLFAVVAFSFLLGPLGNALIFDPISAQIYATAVHFQNLIMVGGITAALADVLLTRSPRFGGHRSSHV